MATGPGKAFLSIFREGQKAKKKCEKTFKFYLSSGYK